MLDSYYPFSDQPSSLNIHHEGHEEHEVFEKHQTGLILRELCGLRGKFKNESG
jgi:hypothetical protein